MRPLRTEQLLAVADEFCALTRVQVRSFAALSACAAVPGARVHGVPVSDTAGAAAAELARTISVLRPLTGENDGFSRVAATVYAEWAEDR